MVSFVFCNISTFAFNTSRLVDGENVAAIDCNGIPIYIIHNKRIIEQQYSVLIVDEFIITPYLSCNRVKSSLLTFQE